MKGTEAFYDWNNGKVLLRHADELRNFCGDYAMFFGENAIETLVFLCYTNVVS